MRHFEDAIESLNAWHCLDQFLRRIHFWSPLVPKNSQFSVNRTQSWSSGHFGNKIAHFYAKLANFVYIIIYSNMKKTWLKVFSTSRWPLLKKWPIIFDFEESWGVRWNLFHAHTEVSQVIIFYGVSARLPRKIRIFS